VTSLNKVLHRVTRSTLDGSFGPDRNRRIVVTLTPGDPDLIELRPLGTRRSEKGAVLDVYRYLLRCRVNAGVLEKARARKAAKAVRLAAARQSRAEARLLR
jgi:hypothetical protein